MKLALVGPLPPDAGPAAEWASALLPQLRKHASVRMLSTCPEQAVLPPAAAPGEGDVGPLADLPHLLESGAVELPIYLVADEPSHAHQFRFVRENPGLTVLLSAGVHRVVAARTVDSLDLDGYRALLEEEHGEAARGWPERFLWRPDRDRVRERLPLTGLCCRRSLGVLSAVTPAAVLRRRLNGEAPETRIEDLPSLADPAAAAAAIVAMARDILAEDGPQPALLPEPDWPAVEVLTVAYNSRKIIGAGLRSIENQDYPNLTCTVIDNGSTDGTADFVRANFKGVQVVDAGGNLGFAGGNNLGFARSKAKYIVLFNQDAQARRDFVRELVRVAERDEKIGAVGGKMLMMRCPTILNSTGVIMNEGGFAVDRHIGLKDVDPSPVPERVLAACGGAVLVRRETLEQIGGFDEAYFMYFEDVDLCWRMRLTGWEVLYAPLAVALHDWHGDLDPQEEGAADDAAAAARNERRRMMTERNRIQTVVKNIDPGQLLRTLVKMRRYDRGRLRSLAAALAAGADRREVTLVQRAIRRANRWCYLRLPQLLLRRRKVQSMRTLPIGGMADFIDPGFGEPDHVGDLRNIQDRFSAKAPDRLRMGVTDQAALGPGWHPLEPVPGEEGGARWTQGEAFAYLAVPRPSEQLRMRVGRGPVEIDLRVRVGATELAPQPVLNGDLNEIVFDLPGDQPVTEMIEIRIRCETFRPSDTPGVSDTRVLGARVAEVWFT